MGKDRIDMTVEIDNTANLGDSGVGKSEMVFPPAPEEVVKTYVGNPFVESADTAQKVEKALDK